MATKKDTSKLKDNMKNSTKAADNKTDRPEMEKEEKSKKSSASTKAKAKTKTPGTENSKSKTEDSDKKVRKSLSLEEKLSESQDKYLRLSAEFDNYRKRTLKEKMDLTKTAGESILTNLLPVMDDFERALQLMESASDCNAMKEGIDLIYSKFQEFLKTNGVKEIEVKNSDFDTDVHEAITKIPAPNKKLKGKVVDVVQKGYYLNEKVMRYAKVVIGE